MAVKLRLKRMGAKQKPYYRIVAADSKSSRDGSFIEVVGTYNPIVKENNITLDEEKVLKWLKNGAQPTDTVKSIFVGAGLWSKFKVNPIKKAKPAKNAITKEEVDTTKTAKKPATKTIAAKKSTPKKSEK